MIARSLQATLLRKQMEIRRILWPDIKTLALRYGGYTSLDKVYLDQLLAGRSEEEQSSSHYLPPV